MKKEPYEIKQHLQNLLKEPKFFDACFNSKKTIKDKLKLWNILEDSDEMPGHA